MRLGRTSEVLHRGGARLVIEQVEVDAGPAIAADAVALVRLGGGGRRAGRLARREPAAEHGVGRRRGLCNLFVPPLRASRFSYQPSADLGRHSPLAPAAHALAGLPDGAGLVLMDPAEVPNQLQLRRRAARDHQPAFQGARGRCAERAETQNGTRFFSLVLSDAAAHPAHQ